MFTNNNQISSRQIKRMGILENNLIPFVVVPFICAYFGGIITFIFGLLFVFLYAFFMNYIGLKNDREKTEYIDECNTFINIIYLIRFAIKAGIILWIFTEAIKKYLMYDINKVVILLCLALVSMYGAIGSIEHRARLMEMIFYLTIIPMLITAIIGIWNIDLKLLWTGLVSNMNEPAAYFAGLLFIPACSALEFGIYGTNKNLRATREKWWHSFYYIIMWVFLSIIISYVLVTGVLGSKYLQQNPLNGISVMGSIGTGINGLRRIDYLVFTFLVVGMFAVISGFYFRGEECGKTAYYKVTQKHNKREQNTGKLNRTTCFVVSLCIFIISVAIGISIMYMQNATKIIVSYLIIIDLPLSMLLPLIYILKNKRKIIKKAAAGLILLVIPLNLTGCWYGKYTSIEKQDYISELVIEKNEDKIFVFELKKADLSEYGGKPGDKISYKNVIIDAENLDAAKEKYFKEEGAGCDLGHLKKIIISSDLNNPEMLLYEFVDSPEVSKSVIVQYNDEKKETLLEFLENQGMK